MKSSLSNALGMTSGAQICLVSPVNRISRSNGLIVLAERYYWVKKGFVCSLETSTHCNKFEYFPM